MTRDATSQLAARTASAAREFREAAEVLAKGLGGNSDGGDGGGGGTVADRRRARASASASVARLLRAQRALVAALEDARPGGGEPAATSPDGAPATPKQGTAVAAAAATTAAAAAATTSAALRRLTRALDGRALALGDALDAAYDLLPDDVVGVGGGRAGDSAPFPPPEHLAAYAHLLRHAYAPLGATAGLPQAPPAPQTWDMVASSLAAFGRRRQEEAARLLQEKEEGGGGGLGAAAAAAGAGGTGAAPTASPSDLDLAAAMMPEGWRPGDPLPEGLLAKLGDVPLPPLPGQEGAAAGAAAAAAAAAAPPSPPPPPPAVAAAAAAAAANVFALNADLALGEEVEEEFSEDEDFSDD